MASTAGTHPKPHHPLPRTRSCRLTKVTPGEPHPIDLVAHEGGNAAGQFAYTLTVTDIATGWTENRSVPAKTRRRVVAALEALAKIMPFPIIGVDSDNGSEFINYT